MKWRRRGSARLFINPSTAPLAHGTPNVHAYANYIGRSSCQSNMLRPRIPRRPICGFKPDYFTKNTCLSNATTIDMRQTVSQTFRRIIQNTQRRGNFSRNAAFLNSSVLRQQTSLIGCSELRRAHLEQIGDTPLARPISHA